jgi:hypothetical protein
MKHFLLGVLVGVILTICFVYFGGGKALQLVGTATSELGKRMQVVEKNLKDTTPTETKKNTPNMGR